MGHHRILLASAGQEPCQTIRIGTSCPYGLRGTPRRGACDSVSWLRNSRPNAVERQLPNCRVFSHIVKNRKPDMASGRLPRIAEGSL